ncbi:tetraprenyl-beta-curcumene synthase family protein [Pradoshia sp.]
MRLPATEFGLAKLVFKDIFPIVHRELDYWEERANSIPNEELRIQAKASIAHKTFHCEGGSILALIAGEKKNQVIRFIVAYQTISDYLDNLCDRSTSLDPDDFSLLHESMKHALDPQAKLKNYYELREDQNDGGYLADLVRTCQEVLQALPHYKEIQPFLFELCGYYCDLQIHKHVIWEERVHRLQAWFRTNRNRLPEGMAWYEFSACAGSTLGIFCLVSYAARSSFRGCLAKDVRDAYFPYVQGLHIMLDYFIDQEEDRIGNDLNFCFYYESEKKMIDRLCFFLEQANLDVEKIPDSQFHQMVNKGLVGIYLADEKVAKQKDVKTHVRKLLNQGGFRSYFFYSICKIYYAMSKKSKANRVKNNP